ncbi:unnamed protein product [Gongylonema pulchrum]|uniref:asparaginase n=1 Tax=Gongylonema pulchrum TaxID=637853 RepID=A0A183EBD6_9BILA|nr:unnamed protein product [Gongylonema pulchrum]
MTVEAALTKLSYVLGKDEWDLPTKRKMMQRNIRGEMTVARFETLQELEISDLVCVSARFSQHFSKALLQQAEQ